MVEIVKDDARGGLEKVVLRSESVSFALVVRAFGDGAPRGARLPSFRPSRSSVRSPQNAHKQGATAEVFLYGSHVVSWKAPDGKVRERERERERERRRPPSARAAPPTCRLNDPPPAQQPTRNEHTPDDKQDVLFMSDKAIFAPPKAIRGGIPVCFPQFGQLGPLGQHGFARNTTFVVEDEESSSSSAVTLLLKATGTEDARFPHPFELRIRTSLSSCGLVLRQDERVRNTGSQPFRFTAALHTYFTVPDVSKLSVEGLEQTIYSDSLDGGKEKTAASDGSNGAPVAFDREVDRIYLNAPDDGTIVARNAVSPGAAVRVRKSGFRDAVVWNPWVEKAKAMADFGDGEYQGMLCIEPAVAKSGEAEVAAGEGGEWCGWQELVYEPAGAAP